MSTHETSRSIRERLGHPVVDIDGHCIEFFPGLAPYLREEGVDLESPSLRRLLPPYFGPDADWYALSPAEREQSRAARPPWWGSPARNTRDLATAMFPGLLYERLDELGIDVSVVYPSVGLAFLHLWDEAERRGACRALNRCNANAFAEYADRLIPVAAIPMHTPEEAIAELEYAVGTLGFKAVLLAGYVQRPVDAVAEVHPDLAPWCTWIDMYGIDSAYDYDPVWQKCLDLGVSVAFHSGSIGWGSRRSISNYMYNHIGHLAEGQHALCKSLFLGGVPHRFPELNFVFLEGGVAWAATLLSDLIGHWEKRNRTALEHLDPAGIDKALFFELMAKHGGALTAGAEPMRISRAARGPGPTRRVRAVWDRARRGHRDAVRAAVLLRLRGRRPAQQRRVQHQGQSVRCPTRRDVRLRRGALGRARHERGARGGVGDGRPRLGRRGRLPRLRLRQPGAVLHRREPLVLRRNRG